MSVSDPGLSASLVSRFNLRVPTLEGPLLFNTATGACLACEGPDGDILATLLCDSDYLGKEVAAQVPETLLCELLASGFIVPADTDEVGQVRDRYRYARDSTPVVLTVTTTLDCNLGCYYCYEERSSAKLSTRDVNDLVDLANARLSAGRRALHVDWYGGEPLLNIEFLEHASTALQDRCRTLGAAYSASVISNGTRWPEDVAGFVKRHAITQVQISFDGLRDHHDRRRRYRHGHAPSSYASSFDAAAALVDRLVQCVRVDIRFNIDRANQVDLLPFLRMAEDRGWFRGPHRASFQPARLSSYSDRSAFLRKSELSLDEFDSLRGQVRAIADDRISVDESEAPDSYPYPRTSVCAALAPDSVVVGADRRLFRCGLQVSEPHRSVGILPGNERAVSLPVLGQDDTEWWRRFDPTRQPRCARCTFLPVCWGGCPKKHLEQDAHALREQGEYWRKNLARLVAARCGRTPVPGFAYLEADQFRFGHPDDDVECGSDASSGVRENVHRLS